ncbi:MAG TPA: hypothetical protein VM597_23155 [Gemmataceae bacterium]|nr:hypothetical protein [Gemmataceae bacterium]
MSTRRFDQENEHDSLDATTQAGVLIAQAQPAPLHRKHADGEDRLSLFWRVFGGTILSIVTLVGITIYNNLSSSISELRSELNRVNEARAELVKKEEFNARTQNVWDRVQSLQELKVTVTAREAQLKVADEERRELAKQLQDLRERLAKVEGATEVKPMVKGPVSKGD